MLTQMNVMLNGLFEWTRGIVFHVNPLADGNGF